MDARDIFRQLTRGAKFKKENLSKKVAPVASNTTNNETNEVQIKVEQCEDEINDNVNEVTLLGSITTDPAKKGKKRKKANKVLDPKKQKLLEEELVNRTRNKLRLKVVGRHVPEPIKSFDELDLKVDLLQNIKQCGYLEPTPIQKQAIGVMLKNRQLLACAPTGSGKTAAFLIPIIHMLNKPSNVGFRAVILCPTRELAKQTQRECIRLAEGRNLKIHSMSKINKALTSYGPKSSLKFDIVVTTPNRLCFLLQQEPPAVSLENVEWLIVDEADKLFEDTANSFRNQMKQILTACSNKNRKIAMFSATYTPIVAKWCVRNAKGLVRITVGNRNAAVDSVEQELLFVGNEAGKLLAIRDIIRNGISPPVLVFVQSKERAQQLFTELMFDGVNVDAIHADRTQSQRDNTVKLFREGKIWVLISTELMARGVDFKGINLVINYDFPSSAISYVHRIGRAGRAGRTGKAITFFTTDDTLILRKIAQVIKQSGCDVPEYMLKLKNPAKRKIKRLKVKAPNRDSISTKLSYKTKRKRQFRNNKKSTSDTTPQNENAPS